MRSPSAPAGAPARASAGLKYNAHMSYRDPLLDGEAEVPKGIRPQRDFHGPRDPILDGEQAPWRPTLVRKARAATATARVSPEDYHTQSLPFRDPILGDGCEPPKNTEPVPPLPRCGTRP
jgi:hypothetical protein